eukprot:scaffold67484_cov67-Phaeocystis_antarctica.AAC.5
MRTTSLNATRAWPMATTMADASRRLPPGVATKGCILFRVSCHLEAAKAPSFLYPPSQTYAAHT